MGHQLAEVLPGLQVQRRSTIMGVKTAGQFLLGRLTGSYI